MIITLIFVVIFVISFIIEKKSNDFVAACIVCASGVIILFLGIGIICTNTGTKCTINQNQIVYESLCKRVEIAQQSEYENVSKSDVIKDVYEWNKDVYYEKYWTYNPFTNWFHNKKVTDALQYVEY